MLNEWNEIIMKKSSYRPAEAGAPFATYFGGWFSLRHILGVGSAVGSHTAHLSQSYGAIMR
jgi:hypothetical protein